MKKQALFTLMALALFTINSLSYAAEPQTSSPDSPVTSLKQGEKLPAAQLTTLSDATISTTQFKYPLILSFFTTWCEVCRKEMPVLANVYQEAKKKNMPLSLVAVDAGEKPRKVASYKKKLNLPFDVYTDTSLSLVKSLQIRGTPVVMIFDKEGRLTFEGNRLPEEWQTLIR